MYILKKIWRFSLKRYKNSKLHLLVSKILEILQFEGFYISYSQFGEDMVLSQIFINKKKGCYVDVGCNRPIEGNNTFKLYLRGWNGINIDGNEKLISQYKKIRKRDINIHSLVSNSKEPKTFYISDDDRVSTVSNQFKEWIKTDRKYDSEIHVVPRTLTEILESNLGDNQIDFLNIDVEGHDLEVLKSLDINKYKPKIICIEDHLFNINEKHKSDIYLYLENHNYKLVAFMKPNIFLQFEDVNNEHTTI